MTGIWHVKTECWHTKSVFKVPVVTNITIVISCCSKVENGWTFCYWLILVVVNVAYSLSVVVVVVSN